MGCIIPDPAFLRKAVIESPSRKMNRFLVWVLQAPFEWSFPPGGLHCHHHIRPA